MPRILIAQANGTLRRRLKALLAANGYDVAAAADSLVDAVIADSDLTATVAELTRENARLRTEIAEQGALQQQFRHTQKLEMIGQLTGGIAHDFNNLLGIIVGNLDLLSSRIAPGTLQNDLLNEALNGALRGAELTQRMLAFALKRPAQPEDVDVNAVMTDTVRMLRRTLGAPIQIETVAQQGIWPTFVDQAQVQEALVNLAINARDAMPNGGLLLIETANVELERHDTDFVPGSYVMLSVTDSGTGMPPEVIERAFEPFFTTKAIGNGSGLGLSMVYGFAKQSRGYARIYSEVGYGTTVKLYLPRADQVKVAAMAKPASPRPTPTGTETILVVEDEPRLRHAAIKMLEELGYHVMSAADGPAAMVLIRQAIPIDLLFTDIIMSKGLKGDELARVARIERPNLRVLFTTGYSPHLLKFTTRGEDPPPVLAKPYRKTELAERVRETLDSL